MPKLKNLLLLLLISLATCLPPTYAVAQAERTSSNKDRKPMSYNGVGTHSCGVYLANMQGVQADIYKDMYQQWGAGFMAGVSNQGRWNPVTDLETYTAWLTKWCTDDPASKVATGVTALGSRLLREK